ncbi:MAG: hypothetical protein HY342_03540 [Candidatus Lambdaproteobacteria bacterium]|nr:hypothetical protein [Candidatus Lambdaproteobacteria bacterium]
MRIVAALLACAVLGATPAMAQQAPKPVMENVFFNVVWGSAAGALVGGAIAVIGATDKEKPGDLSSAGFQGATLGGVAGLGLGIYLVFTGITFDPDRSTIVNFDAPGFTNRPQFAAPPFRLLMDAQHPGRVTGFSAEVLNFRF